MKCSCRTHYTCNMKVNALASCISYARTHRVRSGVGAGYGLFTGVGEWVVNSEKWDKVQGRDSQWCKMIKMINYTFWAWQVGVDPPPPSRLAE